MHIFSSFPTLLKPCISQATLHGGSVFRNALKSFKNAKSCEKCVKDASLDFITEITPKNPSRASQNRPKIVKKWRENPKKSTTLPKNVTFFSQKRRTTKNAEKKRKKAKKGCPRGGGWRLNLTSRENGKRLAIYSYNAAICHCLWKLILQLCHLLLSAALPFVAIVCCCLLLRAAAICCFAQLFAAVYFCSL